MNLFNPLNLLWLLPLGGAILVLWMLKLRRQDVEVSSLYLWRALLQENQANAPFQRLRRSLLLFLQLLTAFLLILALARPFVYGRATQGRNIALIIDTAASMNATDVSPSRLAAAKREAQEFVDREMGPNDVATVIAAANKPVSLVGYTTDKRRLRNAIDGAAATDTVADMPAALTLAQSLVGSRPGAEIRVFSDGTYAADDARKLDALPLGTTDVRFVPIGTQSPDNVALTAMDGRRNPVTGNYEVFVQVQNLGAGVPNGGTLSLLKDGRLIDARALTLTDGSQSETFNSPLLKQGGVITARLDDVRDDLAADNQASLVLPAPRQRRILLVTDGNMFLENGLNLDPDVTLKGCAPGEFATLGNNGAGYAMVVLDNWLPADPLPPGNYLIFHQFSAQTPLAASGGDASDPQLVDQNRTHPVMRFVDLEGLHLGVMPDTTATPWGQTLAEADAGPMIAAGEHNGLRVLSVAFDIHDSDWPVRVSFPIFLTNAVQWLTAAGGLGASAPDTPTGGVASLTLPAGLSSVSITRPDGSTASVAAPLTGGIVVYDGTEQAGLYHAHAGGADYPFAVNLLDKDESTLAVQPHPKLNHPGAAANLAAVPLAQRVKDDLWTDLAAAALVFLTLEWLVFHRRP
ncbi:MAG: VWA domain-containing protein [Armatimonadetes bacterium]|nr:VWA domain-containing protein [Armatimonadota bacterium]